MSIENEIKELAAAIRELTQVVRSGNVVAPVPVAPVPVAPAPVAPAPVAPPPQPTVAPQMPPLPTFTAPATASPAVAPFNTPKGLIEYVMSAYTSLGPQKGAEIQGILTGLGYQNINEVKPEHYPDIVASVEALKARG